MENLIRVGIDLRALPVSRSSVSGISLYVLRLVESLVQLIRERKYHAELVGFVRDVDSTRRVVSSETWQHVEWKQLPKRSIPMFSEHLLVARAFARASLTMLHCPASSIPLGCTIGWSVPVVLTEHDALIYEHPEWFPSGQHISTHFVVPRSLRFATRVIVPSQVVVEQILSAGLLQNDASVRVVAHGVDSVSSRELYLGEEWQGRFSLSRNEYLFFVGTVEPRKNLVRLLQAFTHVRAMHPHLQLVLAGGNGWGGEYALPAVLPDGVVRLGRVTEEEKWTLLRNARAFVYVSLAEGFGLPLLEALRVGKPVLTSDRSPMKELVNGVGEVCSPESVESIAEGLRRVLHVDQLNTDRVREREERARGYTWKRMAEQTWEVYQEAIQIHTV